MALYKGAHQARPILVLPEKRVRVDNQITSREITEEAFHTTCSDTSWHYNSTTGFALAGTKRSMVDYVVPRFRSRTKAGERFFNDLFKEEITVSTVGSGYNIISVANACGAPGSLWKAEYRSAGPTIVGFIPKVPPDAKGNSLPVISTMLSADDVSRVQRLVSTEVLSKVGAGDSDLWESAAEYRQALELLENPLTKLKHLSQGLLKAAESGDAARKLMKEVSGGYLMYRYGISPAMSDIQNILASLTKTTGKKEVTTRAKSQLTKSGVTLGNTTIGILKGDWQNQITDSVIVRGMSLDEGSVSFANNLGFSLKGFLLLPWQLTHYSFVADWFANFSSYIGASLPTFGWKHLGHCLVTQRVTTNTYVLTGVTNLSPTAYTLTSSPTGTIQVVSVTTTRSPLLPASFEIETDFGFDRFKRVADAASLIAQRLVRVNRLLGPTPNYSAFHDKKAYHNWANTQNFSASFT